MHIKQKMDIYTRIFLMKTTSKHPKLTILKNMINISIGLTQKQGNATIEKYHLSMNINK